MKRTRAIQHLAAFALVLTSLAGTACSKDPEVAKREFVQSGDGYAASGRHAEAVIQYRNALQQDPKYGVAQVKLAESYLGLGDRANATSAFVRAADLLPDDLDVQIRAGNMLLVVRRFEDAMSRAERVLSVQPDHVGALVLHANGLAGLNRLEDAVAEIEHVITTDPDRADIYRTLGAVQLMRGDRPQAEAAFKRAIQAAPTSAQAHMALANFYLAAGNQAGTEAELKAAVELDATNVLANRALAYFYIGAGRGSEAEPLLKVVADRSLDATGQMGLAEYYVSQQRTAEARQWFERVATGTDRLAPAARLRLATLDFTSGDLAGATRRIDDVLAADGSNTRALAARAELLAAGGDLDGALTAARGAVGSDHRSAQAQYALGKVHLLRHETSEAQTAFSTAIQLNANLVPAREELAALHLSGGRLDESEQMAQSALALVPTATNAQLTLARVYLAQNLPLRAEPILRGLERQLPDSPAIAASVGLLELRKNDVSGARLAFERALTLDPASGEALQMLTQLDVRGDRPQAARERLDAAMRAAPNDANLKLLASDTAARLGDMPEAERLARAALEVDANALGAYSQLGRIYLRTNRIVAATDEFRQLSERLPRSVAVQTTLGLLLQTQGNLDEAKAVFERVMAIDARAAVAANNLAWIYVEQDGNLEVALTLAQTAKAGLPDRPEVDDTLGWIYFRKGLPALATRPLEDAVGRAPENATYLYHLGAVYAAGGDSEKARSLLSRSLAIDRTSEDAARAAELLDRLRE